MKFKSGDVVTIVHSEKSTISSFLIGCTGVVQSFDSSLKYSYIVLVEFKGEEYAERFEEVDLDFLV